MHKMDAVITLPLDCPNVPTIVSSEASSNVSDVVKNFFKFQAL